MEDPKEYYKSNINNINKNLKELERTISAFAVGRLLIVGCGYSHNVLSI